MWKDLIYGRNPAPPFLSPHCTSAVPYDCISPQVTEVAWQKSPCWFNYRSACDFFYQHVWVAKEGWLQQGIEMGLDAEQQRKVYRNWMKCFALKGQLARLVNITYSK